MARIILNSDDVPTQRELEHAASRLMKDYALLRRMRGCKDIEDPEAMKAVASFVSMLGKREKRKLNKDATPNYDGFDILIVTVVNILMEMDDWEFETTLNETELKRLVKRIRNERGDK